MIDLVNEKLLDLHEAAKDKRVRTRRGSPNSKTIHRWINQGVRGVKLESVMLPSGPYTSELAIMRFIERLSMPPGQNKAETPSQRKKAIARAEKQLQAAGIM